MTRRALIVLVGIVAVALIVRVLLLASGTVSFHSDEAVVGLMARHILQGERPVFFYGQAYMGSLDSWLIAVGFSVLGESVLTIRIVESILYLLVVATGYAVAWRISGRLVVAAVAGLVLAVPTVLLTVYTTATLGGYNETLLFGNLVLLFGWDVSHEHRRSLWRWALLGLFAGLGWWSNGLIVAFALPVAVLILWDIGRNARARHIVSLQAYGIGIGVALVGFFIGSAPWWVFSFQNDFAPLRFYLPASPTGDVSAPSQFAGTDIRPLPPDQRLIGLFLLGLPTVIGLRFPWLPTFFLPVVGIVVVLIYVFALYRLVRRPLLLKPDGRLLIGSMIGLFFALFLISRFSIDPSGRYFLPMALPLGIVLGALAAALRYAVLRVVLVALVIGYQLIGVVSAMTTMPPGITTQFNLETHIPNADDAALIDFLDAHGLDHGYTNYWISFRLAFLSGDRMQYSAALPYKTNLNYTPFDERYPLYRTLTDAAPDAQIAYITANVDAVRERLEAIFAEQGITYESAQVGTFHVYYHFQPKTPRPPLEFAE